MKTVVEFRDAEFPDGSRQPRKASAEEEAS